MSNTQVYNYPHWDSVQSATYSGGRYTRDLIRHEQERSAEIEAIRTALIEGEASGEPKLWQHQLRLFFAASPCWSAGGLIEGSGTNLHP